MNLKYILQTSFVCGFCASSLISCKDKTAPVVDESVSEKVEKPAEIESVTQPEGEMEEAAGQQPVLGYVRKSTNNKAGTIEEIAEKAGFAQYLPQDSEMYFSCIGIESMVAKLRGTQMGKFFEEQMKAADEVDLDALKEDDKYKEFMNVAGEEVFIATGKGSSSLFDALATASMEISKWQYEQTFKTLLSFIDPDLTDFQNMQDPGAMMPSFLKAEGGAVKMLEELEIAPIYVGFKVTDKEKRDSYIKQVTDGMNQMIAVSDMRMMKETKSDQPGGFSGFEWSGEGFVEMIEDQQLDQMMAQTMGQDLIEKYKEVLSKKNFSCLVGAVDDYVVIFVGKDTESLEFAKSPDASLLNNPELAFTKNHAGQDIASLMYISESTVTSVRKMGGALALYANCLSKVLDQTDALGDTSLLKDLLAKLAKSENELYAMMPTQRIGLVASHDEGFKIDSYLGEEYPSLDLETPRNLANIVNCDDAAIYASWIIDDEYSDKTKVYMESIWKVAYEGAKIASDLEFNDPAWESFQNNFKMFDQLFAEDLIMMWQSVSGDLCGGLGSEFAMVMDLKGLMPRVPKVPSVVLENGLIPRLTIVKPVADRAKIAKAWDGINSSAANLAVKLEPMIGTEIKMLTPELAKRYGLDTWSYQLGVTSKDANLAVALNDDYWFLTTSPTGLEMLTNRSEAGNNVKASPGAEMVIKVEPMRVAARAWIKLLEEHGTDIDKGFDAEKFEKEKKQLEEFLTASEELELIDSYTRKEGDEVQSTLHFKMK